jgi:LAO/AO transport system kinase
VKTDSLVRGVLAGSVRDVGRAVSRAERGGEELATLIREIFPATGRAKILGVTGPPGAGKSTLVSLMARALRREGLRVGIVAVDPSSPYSGGAILGDRIRMIDLYTDPGVFIRSMATRGALGGLARATIDAVDILDAAGYERIFIETVGVGQDEVDVVRAADSVAVVLVPGLGDDIQALKAGILEIADVFVVNKSDREGSDRAVAELAMTLDLSPQNGWRPPIVRTVATRSEGIEQTLTSLQGHLSYLAESGQELQRRQDRAKARLRALLEGKFFGEIEAEAGHPEGLEDAVKRVSRREIDPYSAAARLFERFRER